ncbi:MAG: (d)CMP kinase [Bacteroidota bacterium]|nr:(d)CMP kinase [Bacteroidota bacterium]
MKNFVIAIDGHSSCGKSTLAKDISRLLNFKYIDSGAMYRAVTLYALENRYINTGEIDEAALEADLRNNKIDILFRTEGQTKESVTVLNAKNVEHTIRLPKVNSSVSQIAVLPFVRSEMLRQQQEMGKTEDLVMEGRDIGTAVFPNADLKIFLTADIETRAQRRFAEMQSKNIKSSMDEVKQNLAERDHIDSNRAMNPLRKADDAVVLDNSNLSREEQTEYVISLVQERTKK